MIQSNYMIEVEFLLRLKSTYFYVLMYLDEVLNEYSAYYPCLSLSLCSVFNCHSGITRFP